MTGIHRLFLDSLLGVLEGNRESARRAADDILTIWQLRDPCATFYLARTLAKIEHPRAMETFRLAVEGGFHSFEMYSWDPWLDPLRAEPEFQTILAFAEARYRDAARAFVEAGGERLLGPVAAAQASATGA